MNRPEITIGQGLELLALARRLTPDEYQARHRWLVNVTNPEFNIAALEQCLTPTTFGSEIKPPFEDEGGWDIIADGPGDDLLDVANIQQLPMLNEGEPFIKYEEAVRRSAEFGQRAAFRLCDEGNAGKISEADFPVNTYTPCGKTVWRLRRCGSCCAWYVYRDASGFCCDCYWFSFGVDSSSRRLVSK